MTTHALKVAPGLALDADYIGGGTLALLAKKGAGKSYTARVIAEELWTAKIPFVLVDPMGTSWGLRAAADGSPGGLPVAIFGGEHSDAPLERTGGALMADLVVEEGLSMILDLSALGTRSAERQFAHDFFDRLYRRNRDLVHLLVDEADLFAPQKPQPGDAPLLGVTENIVRRGRNRGIGITLITQRPAVLNKDVLTQLDGLVAMRIIGKQDRDAIDAWVMGHGDQEAAAQVKGTLAGLANGECWWWIPELGILQRVQVRETQTFDSSPTKRSGESRREPKSLADVDMGAIEKKMAATIERAKADDPKELHRQIAALRKELAERQPEGEVETVVERVEVPVLTTEVGDLHRLIEECGKLSAGLKEAAAPLEAAATAVVDGAGKIADAANSVNGRRDAVRPHLPRVPPRRPRAPDRVAVPTSPPLPPADGDFRVSPSDQKILDALAWLEGLGLTPSSRMQVGFLAGYKPAGGRFVNLMGGLKTAGLVDYPQPGLLALTDAGRAIAAASPATLTDDELHQAVYARLQPSQVKLLHVLIDTYDSGPISREELAAATGYEAAGGRFVNLVGQLKGLGLVGYPQKGYVQAEEVLFLS